MSPPDDGPLRVLELYSGIGGMHFACPAGRASVVAAVDVNTVANAVYRFNFPDTPLLQRNVQSLTARELDALRIDLITMSPPCQPFTRLGLRRGADDPRASSFLHFLRVLPTLNHSPQYFLLENVRGFETSDACASLLDTLHRCHYHVHRYLLSPSQFGVPNSRLRFYCLAKRGGSFPDCPTACQGVLTDFPGTPREPSSLAAYLDADGPGPEHLLPDEVLSKHALVLDVVRHDSVGTCCFTKGYGHYVEGTGSVLLQASPRAMDEAYEGFVHGGEPPLEKLRGLRLRYFTPDEVARLMCFPERFKFPPEVTVRQRYRLLGNSVNVRVVRALFEHLLHDANRSVREAVAS